MREHRTLLALCVMGLALTSHEARAQCGGVCLYENGTPELGRAAAGAGARAQDAATAFWNPAGMTELEGHAIQLGVIASWSELNPQLDEGTVTGDPTPVGGGDATSFGVLFGGHFVVELPHDVYFGMSSTALYGGAVSYGTQWTGRGYVVDASLVGLLIQPTFAYAVNDWLSLGAGPAILYTKFDQRVKAASVPNEPTIKLNGADGWSAGAVVSALLKPANGTRIGLYYRSRIKAETDGSVQGSAPVTVAVDTDFTFPQGVNVSLYQQIGDRWALLMDGGWTDWSEFSNIPIQVGPVAGVQARGWNDTWRLAIGAQFTPHETLTVQAGYGYDSAPVSADRLLPDIPAGQQMRFSCGVQLRPTDYLELSLGYQFQWFPNLDMDGVALPPSDGVVLHGKYQGAWANQAGVTATVTF